MKVCLYLEAPKDAFSFKNSFENQKKGLLLNNVNFHSDPEKWDYDILHLQFMGPKSINYALKAKRKGIKVITHAHTTAEDFRNSIALSNIISHFMKPMLSWYYSLGDLIITVSPYTKDLLKNKYKIKKKVVSLSNGVDFDKFKHTSKKAEEFIKKYHLKKKIIFGIGYVFYRKGIHDFIDVSKKFNNSFVWVGKKPRMGANTDNFEDKIKKAPKNFILTGFIKDIIAAYSAGDIYCSPSYEENEGMTILEAACMGKPLIVRDLPVYHSFLENGKNCLMCNNNKEFETAIKRLINDPRLCKKLGNEAQKMAKKKSIKNTGKQLKKYYEELLKT